MFLHFSLFLSTMEQLAEAKQSAASLVQKQTGYGQCRSGHICVGQIILFYCRLESRLTFLHWARGNRNELYNLH